MNQTQKIIRAMQLGDNFFEPFDTTIPTAKQATNLSSRFIMNRKRMGGKYQDYRFRVMRNHEDGGLYITRKQ